MVFSAYSPIYFVIVASLAFLTSFALDRLWGAPMVKHRESALDGLRGFLVIGVVVHHAAFWISRKVGAPWTLPQGALSALGPVCVILFFMTTAFLYFGKLLRDRGQRVDWLHILISRVCRLMPLCIFMAVAAFGVALFTTGFVIVDDIDTLFHSFLRWASAGLGGSPDINSLKRSWEINAGVVWTLKYEILFYICLPFIGFAALVKPSSIALAISALFLVLIFQVFPNPELRLMMPFSGGVLAAYATQRRWLAKICKGPVAAIVFVACIGSVIFSPRNTYGALSLILLTVAFVIVACDNNIFGLLSLRSIRSFGDVGYSAYLLHGLLLYLAFHSENVSYFNSYFAAFNHWITVSGITILLVVICRWTFIYIELPGMNAAPIVQAWIEKIIKRRTRPHTASGG